MGRPARIAIAGGGTGGHVFPALGIADAIREQARDTEFMFFGTADKIESTVVPERGFPFRAIWISGLHRSLRPSNLLFPVKVPVALMQSWWWLRRFRPDVAVGTGGYVCGPVLLAAAAMGVPTMLHESNSYPGITTRMLSGRVGMVLTGSEETGSWLPRARRVEVVGTPVRSFGDSPGREESRTRLSLSTDDRVVLVVGGSQGAASINRAIAASLDVLRRAGIRVVWQTGRANEHGIRQEHGSKPGVTIVGFIEDMGMAYAAADLVVSRAGASTIAELALTGRPAILVPYPFAADDHQMKNARSLEARGAATVVPDVEAGARLTAEIIRLMDDSRALAAMTQAMSKLATPHAARAIATMILKQVQER